MLVPIFKTTSACCDCEAQNFDGLLASHIMHLICGGILLGGKGVYGKYNLNEQKLWYIQKKISILLEENDRQASDGLNYGIVELYRQWAKLKLALTTHIPLIFHTQFHVCQASRLKKESHMCYVTAKVRYFKYYIYLEIGFRVHQNDKSRIKFRVIFFTFQVFVKEIQIILQAS